MSKSELREICKETERRAPGKQLLWASAHPFPFRLLALGGKIDLELTSPSPVIWDIEHGGKGEKIVGELCGGIILPYREILFA